MSPRLALGPWEYGISDPIDLLIQSEQTFDTIRLNGWRVDIGYPEDREEAEARLKGEFEAGELVEVADGD